MDKTPSPAGIKLNSKINPFGGLGMGQAHKRLNPGKLRLLLGCYGLKIGHGVGPY